MRISSVHIVSGTAFTVKTNFEYIYNIWYVVRETKTAWRMIKAEITWFEPKLLLLRRAMPRCAVLAVQRTFFA